MATLTLSATEIDSRMSVCSDTKPSNFFYCKDYFAATTIQSAVRMYLAKKEWEILYVQHIQNEVLRLREEAKANVRRARKRKYLDQHATVVQSLTRGYIVRSSYRESDRILRNHSSKGMSLMEAVQRRMDIRQRIETLKQRVAEARAAKGRDSDTEKSDDVSRQKLMLLKGENQKLQIKAKTLEAVSRPLQEKFNGLRTEHEKLSKRFRKLESKNNKHRSANEGAKELLQEKIEAIQATTKELASTLSLRGVEQATHQRSKAQKRLDTLVETSSQYANLGGMSERDASAFADEVSRIGREAHKKAKLFRDSMRSHISMNSLAKTLSSRKLTSGEEDSESSTETTVISEATTETENKSPQQEATSKRKVGKRRHGRILQKLMRDRSLTSLECSDDNRSVSPPLQRQDGSFNNNNSGDAPRVIRKGKRIFIKRDGSRRSVNVGREQHRTPSPQRRESFFVKRDRSKENCHSVSPTSDRSFGSHNNTPVISNKMKIGKAETPKLREKLTPTVDNSETPKMNNKHTPKTSNVKPLRRISSQSRSPSSELKSRNGGMRKVASEQSELKSRNGGLRKVASERKVLSTANTRTSTTSSRLTKLREELRDECRSTARNQPKEETRQKEEARQPRRRSSKRISDESGPTKSSPRGNKKKEKASHNKKRDRFKKSRPSSLSASPPGRSADKDASEPNAPLNRKRNSYTEPLKDQPDQQRQPRRHVSLKDPTTEIRKNKRSHLRKAKSLTAKSMATKNLNDSAQRRKRFVDQCVEHVEIIRQSSNRGLVPPL